MTRSDVAQPWDRIRHGGNRIASPDVRCPVGFEGQDRQALDAEPASDADTGDRVGLGGIDPQLRRRGGHGALHRGPPRRVLHRTGRIPAIQPGVVSACRSVRSRHVHRVIAANRPRRQLVDGHRRPAARLRGRPEHGTRPARSQALVRRVAQPRARGGECGARSKTGRTDRPDIPEGRDPHVCRVARRRRGRQECRHADPAGDDLRRRRQPCRHRGGCRVPVQNAVADRPPGGVVGDRRRDTDRTRRRCRPHGATTPRRVGGFSGRPRYRCAASGSVALAARSIEDLVAWSGGLYDPPAQFRDW